jgi:type VI secretion system FHA domain protein
MPLHLRVTSDNRDLFGDDQVKEFAGSGGTMGRALDNDWVFPDPHRYVSGRHALIDFQDGAYYLVDTSRNGVFLNDDESAVGRGKPKRLFDGDIVRIGDYAIAVKITPEKRPSKKKAKGAKPKIRPKKAQPVVEDEYEDDDWDDKFGVEELLPDDDSAPRERLSDSVVRAQLVPEDESMEIALVDEAHLVGNGSFDALLEDNSAPHTQRSEMVPSLRELDSSRGSDDDRATSLRAMNLFLKSAGLKPRDMAGMDPAEVLQAAGLILRQMVEGLTKLLEERADLKASFRLGQTTVLAGSENPLKFSSSTGDALKYLLGNGKDGYPPPTEAVQDCFQSVNDHEQAIPKAMEQAFKEFMDHFAPSELRQQFDHYLKKNRVRGLANKRKYWDLYEETFSELTRGQKGALPDAFSQEFAKAYKQEVDSIKSSRKK